MILIVLALWLATVLVLSHFTRLLAMRAASGFLFRALIFPGIVLHELSHYAMCKLTGARVDEVKLFDRQRVGRMTLYSGFVKHGPSQLPYVGDPLISFAPLIGGLLVLALLTWLFDDPLAIRGTLGGRANLLSDTLGVARELLATVAGMLRRFPAQVAGRWSDWRFWLYLYLALSISMSLVPSRQDFANSLRHLLRHALVFFVAMAAVVGLFWLGSRLAGDGRMAAIFVPWLFGLLAFTACVQVAGLLLAGVAAGAASLHRRL